jgi:hypothetical protein
MGGALALTGGEGLEPADGDASVPAHLHTSPAPTRMGRRSKL